MSLGIALRPQFSPVPGDFDLRPKAVQAFVAALPLADPLEAAHALLEALRETNELAHPAAPRLGFLVAIKGPLKEITCQLARRLAAEQFPLSGSGILLARLLMRLQRETALGYLYAAEAAAQTARRGPEELAFAVLNGLHYFGQMLLTAYQARLPHVADAWSACHALYLFAEREQIHDFRPPNSQRDISGAYKRILLLGACDPSRFRQHELATLYGAFERHAAAADLLPPEFAPAEGATLFVVGLDSNHAPVRRDFRRGRALGPQERLLWVDPLAQVLLREGEPEVQAVARAVTNHWQRAPKRKERFLAQHPFELLLGFTEVHRALVAQAGGPLAELFDPARFGDEEPPAGAGQPLPSAQRWFSADMSERGVRLTRALDEEVNGLQVGVLVAVRLAEADFGFRLGAVRWFRNGLEGALEVGIELIGLEPRPAAVQAQGQAPQRGIVVESVDQEGRELILVPGRGSAAGVPLTLVEAAGSRRAQFTEIIERTPGYTLYGLEEYAAEIWGEAGARPTESSS